MDFEIILNEAEAHMKDAVLNFQEQIRKINTGSANTNLIASIKVKYYETLTPLQEIASITVPEARQILITPYDRSVIKGIVHAIIADQTLGFTPYIEGNKVRITIPALTEERRLNLVKKLKELSENAKVTIRHWRQHANKRLEELESISKDLLENHKKEIQNLTQNETHQVDDIFKVKEVEITTI